MSYLMIYEYVLVLYAKDYGFTLTLNLCMILKDPIRGIFSVFISQILLYNFEMQSLTSLKLY